MKRLTPELTQALAVVCYPATWIDRLVGVPTRKERDEALHRLREEQAARAAPPLLRRLFELGWSARPGRDELAAAIEGTLASVQPKEMAWIDRAVRVRRPCDQGELFDALTPASLARWISKLAPHVRVLGLIACHRSGFVRESALDWIQARLRSHATAVETALPFLALRVNDRVPQVAAKAITLLRELIVPLHRKALIAQLPHLVHMLHGRREHEHDLAERVRAFIKDSDADEALNRFESDDSATLRFVADTLESRPVALRVLLIGCWRGDRTLRLHALRRVVELLPPSRAHQLLARVLARDEAAHIRLEAMTQLATRAPEQARQLLPDWLFDRSSLSRAVARDLGRTLDAPGGAAFDARVIYREAIALPDISPRALAIAVSGLGEAMLDPAAIIEPSRAAAACTGQDSVPDSDLVNDESAMIHHADVERLAALADHPGARVRLAALRALARAALDRALPLAADWIMAREPRVRGAAFRLLRTHVDRVDLAAIRARLARADPALRVEALGLLQAAPKWDALIFLLDALADPDEAVRREAVHRLTLWVETSNQSQRRATRAQLARIDELLETRGIRLSEETLRELRFAARSAAATALT